MVNWIGIGFIVRMTAGLAFIGIVGALTIDNQLTVIKNDCFERLAIGEKLNPRDIYISLEVNTVPECQRECTKDEEKCRSFSFGIGIKGNASCELSSKVVKETIDLKPIGTVSDQDFDLYIKKLGCKLVIEHKPIDITTQSDEPVSLFGAESKPAENSNYNQQENKKPESNSRPESPQNNQRPYQEKVKTDLISVRPDPNRPAFTGLGPALGYFDSDKPIGYEFDGRPVRPLGEQRPNYHDRPRPKPSPGFDPGYLTHDIDRFDKLRRPYVDYYNDDRPPFRPQVLNFPYDSDHMKPRPNDLDRIDGPASGYGPSFKPKPISEIPNRPTHRPRPEHDRFDFDFDRPYLDRPGYDRPTERPTGSDYEDRPAFNRPSPGYDRPHSGYESDHRPRPSMAFRPMAGYNSFDDRPGYDRPDEGPGYGRPDDRPGFGGPDRPRPESGYGSPDERPRPEYEAAYGRPDNRPRPDNGPGYGRPDDRPRPDNGPGYGRPDDRPRPDIEPGYGRPDDRPRPHNGPDYGRPDDRPNEELGYGRPDDRPRPDYGRPDERPGYGHESGYAHPDNRPRPGYGKPDDGPGYGRPDNRPRPGYEKPYDRPEPGYTKPDDRPGYGHPEGGHRPAYNKPNGPGYGGSENRPRPGDGQPNSGYDKEPSLGYDKPTSGYDKPDNSIRPVFEKPEAGYGGNNDRPNYGVDVNKGKPESGYGSSSNSYNDKPHRPNRPYDPNNPNVQNGNEGSSGYKDMLRPINIILDDAGGYGKDGADVNKIGASKKPEDPHGKPIITHMIGPHGEQITSIITELKPTCFRRTLAEKRVTRSLVRRSLACEKVEECQQECAEEKRFLCEGFNYRLDPTGRGNGDCELLDLPIVRLDVRRDIFSDPDYDVYERDRNGASDCKGYRYRPRDVDRRYDRVSYDRRPFYDDRRMGDRRGDGYYYSDRHDYRHRYHDKYLPEYLPKPPMDKYYFDRERDRNYWGLNKWGSYGGLYGNFGKPATLYGDVNRFDYENIHRFDYGNRRHDYLPGKVGGSRDWGAYGGSYGTGGYSYGSSYKWGISHEKGYSYDKPKTGLNYLPAKPSYGGISYGSTYGTGGSYHYEINKPSYELSTPNYGPLRPSYVPPTHPYVPPRPSYVPSRPLRPQIFELSKPYSPPLPSYDSPGPSYDTPPSFDPARPPTYEVSKPVTFEVSKPPIFENGYDYPKPPTGRPRPNYGSHRPSFGQPKPNYNHHKITENHFYSGSDDVVEHKHLGRYDFLKDECSLRTATGFRLHKIIVKKLFSVPDIYECEMLCFKERDFDCLSYAYRYTTHLNTQNDNCYLSNRNYKELDFYTDLEPDRDFDIYTMNNVKKCIALPRRNELSDCFWHTRSGQRLDYRVVRDSMNVKSIADCQAECIRSRKFLCRAFSFRYGSSTIGGSIDNCQLTDWPFMELDPRSQLVPEYGFEIYERGSFGYGCEPNHFSIRGKDHPVVGANTDQLCYVGYGTPARLLPQAIKKSLYVNSELDCRIECTKTRHETLFQCMSFSFRTKYERGETNCDLSDILQRDLLTIVDYVSDPDSWLFAWDNYNPECVVIATGKPVAPSKGPSYIGRDEDMDISRYGGYDSFTALDTWRVYSVSGWPCRRGTSCKENRQAGFWYCELEGGDADTWDYCCRPDHQCGYSEGFPYQWCHVGPRRTQWRKCSDRYYPYIFNLIDRHDYNPIFRPKPYLPDFDPQYDAPPFITGKPIGGFTPSFRPDRPPPPSSPLLPPRKPSLNEYEQEFNKHFLDPPKPGGFGQPRHWPVSYLHREMPPDETNMTEYKFDKMKRVEGNRHNVAIQNLIEIIKSKDINNIQYQISNETDKKNDILLVKIPLPTNFTEEKTEKTIVPEDALSKPIDIEDSKVPITALKIKDLGNKRQSRENIRFPDSERSESFLRQSAVRRGFVERTNITRRGLI